MISVTPLYKSLLAYLLYNIDISVLTDLFNFFLFYSDDEISKFDKLSAISDSLESFCEANDLPEGFWMNYGSEIDIIKDLFYIMLYKLCVKLQKS